MPDQGSDVPSQEGDRTAVSYDNSGLTVEVLGPLAVHRAGQPVAIGPARLRLLLALLALRPAEVVPREEIVRVLWGDDPPPSYANLIHVYVSQLRARLRQGAPADGSSTVVVRRVAGGYQLGLDPEAVDLTRFNRLVATARSAVDDGAVEAAITAFEEALGCWRGPMLMEQGPGIADLPTVAAASQRRVDTAIEYARVCDRLRRHRRAAEALLVVAEAAPLHEGLHAQLIRVLLAAGDRAAAVATYQQVCHRLADELGVDPGAQLRSAYLDLLDDTPVPQPVLTVPGASPPARSRARRWQVVAWGAVLVLVVAIVGVRGWIGLHGGSSRPDGVSRHSGAAVGEPLSAGGTDEVEHFTAPELPALRWSAYDGDRSNGASWSASAVRVDNGELQIIGTGRNPTGDGNVAGGVCWCGENGLIRAYGTWQVAARFDSGTGFGMIIGLYSATAETEYLTLARVDDGARTRMYPVLKAHGREVLNGPVIDGNFTEWNVYSVEWRPGFVAFSLNGKVVFDTRQRGGDPPRIPTTPMYLYFSVVPGPDGPVPGPDGDTPATVTAHVDWARYTA